MKVIVLKADTPYLIESRVNKQIMNFSPESVLDIKFCYAIDSVYHEHHYAAMIIL